MIHDKLVRDRIPEIIAAQGGRPVVKQLGQEAYLKALERKLEEELAEYLQSGELEELADLMEVIYALSEAKGCPVSQLEAVRAKKAAERGGFQKRLLLVEVPEQ